MKHIFNKIIEGLSWVILAKWYKGGDMGDGIMVSILSLLFFMAFTVYSLIEFIGWLLN